MRQLASRLLSIAAVALCGAQASAADRPYEFGVFPFLTVAKIQEYFEPIEADFEAKLGRPVRLSTKPNYSSFREALLKETYDIAFVQPFDYVEAHDKHGYLPLARRSAMLEALILVRPDSPLKSLKELKGKTIANPPVEAAVSHLTSMALRDAGINPETGVRRDYGRSHFTCMQAVLIGDADACGTAEQAVLHFHREKQMTTRLRVLHRTPPIASSLFIVHKRVTKRDRDILLRTIVDWPKTEEGERIVNSAQVSAFVQAHDAEYDPVRRHIRVGKVLSRGR
jgi:phosphonate transport system substrate-binding protein